MLFKNSYLHWFIQRKLRKNNITTGGHSQYGQDVTVYELLNKPSHGVFLDIGANDGVTFSNSLYFEEKGWTGICVEPHPTIFESLSKSRQCHLLNACIAATDGVVNFLSVEGPANMLSGIVQYLDQSDLNRIDEEIAAHGGHKHEIQIEALSPETLLQRFNITEIDYLSIDTEGCELSILKVFDFDKTPVKVIGVENGSRSPELFHYLSQQGYQLNKCVGCDEIYTRK